MELITKSQHPYHQYKINNIMVKAHQLKLIAIEHEGRKSNDRERTGANNNGGNASSQPDIKLKEYQQTFCREYHIR